MSDARLIDELRLVGIPGTNKVMAGELSRLARRAFDDLRLPAPRKEGLGTLVYPFDPRLATLAVRYLRTASRVLWSLFASRAARLEPLYDELLAAVTQDTRPWCREGTTFSVSPSNTQAFAAGDRQIVGVVKNALIDGAARRGLRLTVDPEAPQLHLVARLHDDELTVSIDLAGRPMNQRGYRTERGQAPLRENLAAVLVMLARHDARCEALIDPMAGSGTIAVEAACMAQGRPLWIPPREPAARTLPELAESLARPAPPLFADTRPLIIASDVSREMQDITLGSIARAGVAEQIEVWCGDFRKIEIQQIRELTRQHGFDPGRGVILSNPPYGERQKPLQLEELYRDLGRWCRQLRGWRAAFLVSNTLFEQAFGGRPRIKKPLKNGALPSYFYLYDL